MTIFDFEPETVPYVPPDAVFAGPRPGWVDTFKAGREAAYLGGRVDSRDIAYRRAYDPVVDALNADLAKAPTFGVSPDREKFVSNPYLFGRQVDPRAEAAGAPVSGESRIWNEIARRRKTNPGFLSHIGKTRDEFIAKVNAKASADLARAEQTASEGAFVPMLTGAVAGSLTDPLNLGTMLLGAGPAKNIMQAAIREAGINAAVEAVASPIIAERRAELGQETTLGDVATNIAAAGILGGVIGGGTELGARVLRGPIRDVLRSDREVLEQFDAAIPEPSAEQVQIRQVLQEAVEVQEASPLRDTPEGVSAHMARLNDAVVALQNDMPAPTLPPIRADQTPEFEAAFGRSVAVDTGGEPLLLSRVVSGQEGGALRMVRAGGDPGPDAVYARIENPLLLERGATQADIERALAEARRDGQDGVVIGGDEFIALTPEQIIPAYRNIDADGEDVAAAETRLAAHDQRVSEGAAQRAAEIQDYQAQIGDMPSTRESRKLASMKADFEKWRTDQSAVRAQIAGEADRTAGARSSDVSARSAVGDVGPDITGSETFSSPNGDGQREQVAMLDHEVRASGLIESDVGFALEEAIDGADLRTAGSIAEEIEADTAALSALEACLK